jgi:hypothetical protein
MEILFFLLIHLHHRTQSLNQGRMRVMVHAIPWIRAHCSEILQMNLAQPALQLLAHSQVNRKLVGSKFTMTRESGQCKRQHLINRRPDRLKEKKESNHAGNRERRVIKSECGKEILRGIAQRENVKCRAKINLCDAEICQCVTQLPVT